MSRFCLLCVVWCAAWDFAEAAALSQQLTNTRTNSRRTHPSSIHCKTFTSWSEQLALITGAMDPFGGLKISSTAAAPATAAKVSRKNDPPVERMSWMLDPAGLARAIKERQAGPEPTEEEREAAERRREARKIIEREIKQGIREADSGARYGLTYRRPAGSLSGIEEARLLEAKSSGVDSTGPSEKELFKRIMAGATDERELRGDDAAPEGDASRGMRGDMSSSSKDRLAARKVKERAANGGALANLSDQMVKDALAGPRTQTSRSPSISSQALSGKIDGGSSWRRRMQHRRMEKAAEVTGTLRGLPTTDSTSESTSRTASSSSSWRDRQRQVDSTTHKSSGPARGEWRERVRSDSTRGSTRDDNDDIRTRRRRSRRDPGDDDLSGDDDRRRGRHKHGSRQHRQRRRHDRGMTSDDENDSVRDRRPRDEDRSRGSGAEPGRSGVSLGLAQERAEALFRGPIGVAQPHEHHPSPSNAARSSSSSSSMSSSSSAASHTTRDGSINATADAHVRLDATQLNRLMAASMKAGLRGDRAGATRLKEWLAAAKRGEAVPAEAARAAGRGTVRSDAGVSASSSGPTAGHHHTAVPSIHADMSRSSSSAAVRRRHDQSVDGDSSGDDRPQQGRLGRRRGGYDEVGDTIRSKRGRDQRSHAHAHDDDDDDDEQEMMIDPETGKELLIVSGLDASGVPLRSLRGDVAATREDMRAAGSRMRGKRRLQGLERDERGNVTSYGPADDGLSLNELVAREKAGGGPGADAALTRSILKMGHSFKAGTLSGSRAGADEDAELDARLVRTDEDRLTATAQRERDLKRAAAADAKASRSDASDPFNPSGSRFPRHLLVAAGKHWAVLATPGRALHRLHCVMVPLVAVESVVAADEEVYAEGNAWRAALHSAMATPLPTGSAGRATEDAAAVAVGDDEGWVAEPPVFCETVMDARPGRGRRTRVDVIPVPEEAAADAAVFFSKAMQEAEEETSSAAVIDTAGKGLRRCVPNGFAYAHAAWAGGGYVHPIENASTYPRDLLVDVAAGLTGAPPSRFGRREMSRPESEGRAAARELANRLEARGASCVDAAVSASLGAAISSCRNKASQ